MSSDSSLDAVVVGSGPNGLAAAVRMAQAGLSVRLIEANETIGGGLRSMALTEPGYVHDHCSAIHPMAVASPFFSSLELEKYGLEWIHADVPLAHPLEGGRVAVLDRSLERTVELLRTDGPSYRRAMRRWVDDFDALSESILRPLIHVPRHPILLARFGLQALQPATLFARRFQTEEARALFAGLAAHSLLELEAVSSSAIGLVLGAAGHSVGWPMPKGGAQSIADALARLFRELGGEIEHGRRVKTLDELPEARVVLLDLTVKQFADMASRTLSSAYLRWLHRFEYGPGVFKIDYAMTDPVPWSALECRRAGTVHVGGTLEEIAASERAVARGEHPERPYILVAEHSRFDASRAPDGRHTLWAYCHVPNGSEVDMTARIERQIERFAPGFRDCILARHAMGPARLEEDNANLVGGDINGGSAALSRLVARPVPTPVPYRTPLDSVYLCSSSTPPGGGVHGMCGFHAAEAALGDWFS